jgi:hypothetical protein
MNLVLEANISIAAQPDGAGAMTTPFAQVLTVKFPNVQVSNSGTTGLPSAATIATAVSTLGTLINSNFGTLNLGTIQNWATGNP